MLGEAFDVLRQAKKVLNVFACFSSHGFFGLFVNFTSVWAVLLVILNEVEVCPLFAALRVFCHAQHICNMHVACCAATQRCNLRCFAAHFRDVKKVELHLKDRLSKCAEEARIVNYRVAWPRNTPCCVHVAHVLRMTKPTRHCEGCKILKCRRYRNLRNLLGSASRTSSLTH